jgi:ABC-2 type transport system ATP-binding protein
MGSLPENTPRYLDMDVGSYLGFVSEVKGIAPGERGKQILEAMEETGIKDVANRMIGKLSKGYRQRVGLAQALIGNPKVLILDEPTVGLDPSQIREIRQLIKDMAGKRTVILSTHILPEVSMICERVLIIHQGRIVAADAVGELKQRSSATQQLQLIVKAPADQVHAELSQFEGLDKLECVDMAGSEGLCQVSINLNTQNDLRPDLANRIVGKNWPLYEIRSMEPSLEEIFVDIIAREKEEVSNV